MDKNMKGIGRLENNMDKECGLGVMEMFMKVSMWMGFMKASEYTGRQMDKNMKGIGRLENNMDKECGLRVMEMFMKVSLWMG